MPAELVVVLVVVGASVLLALGVVVLYAKSSVRVQQGHALIVNRLENISVHFTGAIVVPLIHRAETMDTTAKTIRISRKGKDALSCRDGIRADVVADFTVRVQPTVEDVLKVAQSLGTARASDPQVLHDLFEARFTQALAEVAKAFEFEHLDEERMRVPHQLVDAVGPDLSGFVLDHVSLVHLEQTPVDCLDPDNLLDAKGIAKIRELTTRQRMDSARIETQCKELLVELERVERDALARLREATGAELRREELEERLRDRLRELVADELDR